MKLSKELLTELQKRLKIGNRRGVHLNAIPKNSSYKLDFSNLSIIDEKVPYQFLETLLSKKKFTFEISWNDIDIDLFNTTSADQKKFGNLGKSFNNIFNHVMAPVFYQKLCKSRQVPVRQWLFINCR